MDNWGNDLRKQQTKPRTYGVTMVMDKGLGLGAFEDLLTMATPYIDFIKLGFGTLALIPTSIAKQKVQLAKQYDVNLYPGGTFFEFAYSKQKVNLYLEWLGNLGFTWVEISNGVIELDPEERISMIQLAEKKGFHVLTEIGKKQAGSITPTSQLVEQFKQDIATGASYVIIEGRETGENIGIFNKQGEVDTLYVQEVNESVDSQKCIWETPQKGQQVSLMQLLGPNVNLGNIAPADILSVEALRQGLRADTFSLWRDV
jgi:phosphosulfolactate synthase